MQNRDKLFQWALILAILTIVYNIAEGVVSAYFGIKDETLTLFGFGADSFVETVSALGVTRMIHRIRKNPASHRGPFEISALRITGWCFYALAVLLSVTAIYSIIEGHKPVSTIAGAIIGAVSILTMWLLIRVKLSVGSQLDSAPLVADARCNLVCLYMSVVLLLASGLWWLFEVPYVDAAGALALVYFSFNEGREAFEKARGIECDDCG